MSSTAGTLSKDSGHKVIDQGTGMVYGVEHEACRVLTDDLGMLADLRERTMALAVPDEEKGVAT